MKGDAIKKGCLIVIGLLVALFIIGSLLPDSSDKPPASAQPGKAMYFCGYDRCSNSLGYGDLISRDDIQVWERPDPDRGKRLRHASHGERVIVIQEKRVNEGAGGLWYELQGVGWTNDFWLTEVPCTEDNLDELSQEF